MRKIKLNKRKVLYSASFILGMTLFSVNANAEDHNDGTSTSLNTINENDTTITDETNEQQQELQFAKVLSSVELVTPETLESTHLSLPVSQ